MNYYPITKAGTRWQRVYILYMWCLGFSGHIFHLSLVHTLFWRTTPEYIPKLNRHRTFEQEQQEEQVRQNMKIVNPPEELSPVSGPYRPLNLLKLPVEIRNKIYQQYYLGRFSTGNVYVRLNGSNPEAMGYTMYDANSPWSPINHALLLTNSTVSEEAQSILYGLLSFAIEEYYGHAEQRSTIDIFLTRTKPQNRDLISRLDLSWHSGFFARPNNYEDDIIRAIQAKHREIWHPECNPADEFGNFERDHTEKCNQALAAIKKDLDATHSLTTRVEQNILASLRDLARFQGVRELFLTFPTPNLPKPQSIFDDYRDEVESEPYGSLRPCGWERRFFDVHIGEICEVLGEMQGVRFLRLLYTDDLEKVSRLAIAMGVAEVVVDFPRGWPFDVERPIQDQLPDHWIYDKRPIERKRVRRVMRPWTADVLVKDKVDCEWNGEEYWNWNVEPSGEEHWNW